MNEMAMLEAAPVAVTDTEDPCPDRLPVVMPASFVTGVGVRPPLVVV